MKRILVAAALLLSLAACAGQPSKPVVEPVKPVAAVPNAKTTSDPLQGVQTFTVTDLNNAEAIFTAANDQIAMPCPPAVAQFIQSIPALSTNAPISGAFSAYAQGRELRLQVQGVAQAGVPTALKIACAPLLMDEQTFWTRLLALAGVAYVAAPVAPAILGGIP